MSTLQKNPKKDHSAQGRGLRAGRDWKTFFKGTIVLVFLISLAVHVLLLVGFGGVAIFKGKTPTMPFAVENMPTEQAIAMPPPTDEVMPEESRPDDIMPNDALVAEESAPPLEMMTVPGGASWAPAIPKDMKTSLTGGVGGTGAGTSTGTATGKGAARATVKLFGVEVKAKKLGVIVSINKGAQSSGKLPVIFTEIFKLFPDSPVFLTNGGGMRDWELVESEYNKKVEENNKKKKAGEHYEKVLAKEIKKPEVGRFNSAAAMDWVVIRGFKLDPEYVGLKEKHPELFEDLRRRNNVWFISSTKEADGAYLAFSELLKKGVEAIYWYNAFDRPIEGKESERIAQQIKDSKIEILIQNQGERTVGQEWLDAIGAELVK